MLGIAQAEIEKGARPTHNLVISIFDRFLANADAIHNVKGGSKLVWVVDNMENPQVAEGYPKDSEELPAHIRKQAEHLINTDAERVKVRVVFATGKNAHDTAFGLIKSAGSAWRLMKLPDNLATRPANGEGGAE